MSQNLERLKKLLAELFQFDQAELDFGIYRIINKKRDEIVRFLDRDLLPQVREAFQAYEAENRGAVKAELDEAIKKAKELGVDPETTQKVKELRAKLAQAVDVTALENEVYSHLYNFFRCYYGEVLERVMECTDQTYVNGSRVWQHELLDDAALLFCRLERG
jgi:adenine-specific DNA-methyltransferase